MMTPRLRPTCLTACLLTLAVTLTSQAHAQLKNLDDGEFIDTLRQEGMSELLFHYVENAEDLDPVTAQLAKIAQLRLDAGRLRASLATTPPAEQLAVLEQARRTIREAFDAQLALAANQPDHPSRAIWLTDAVDLALFQILPSYYSQALSFDEFGLTLPDQQEAVAYLVPRAYAAAVQADNALFNLFNQLGGNQELNERIKQSGLNFKLEQYRDEFTPFYLALAAYHTARLSEDHPYFADLASNPFGIDQRADTPAAERQRLLDTTIELGQKIAADSTGSIKTMAQRLAGSALTRSGQPDQGLIILEEAFDPSSREVVQLLIGLSQSEALEAQSNARAAEDLLLDLFNHPAVQNDPDRFRLPLLVTDALHRLQLAQAEKLTGTAKSEAVSKAYAQPYQDLLTLDQVSPLAEGVQSFVNNRWAQTLGDDVEVNSLPDPVRVGIAEVTLGQANAASGQEQWAQAVAAYERALTFLEGTADGSAPDSVKGTSLFYQGIAKIQIYTLRTQKLGEKVSARSIFEAAQLFTRVAREFPDDPRRRRHRQCHELLAKLLHQPASARRVEARLRGHRSLAA